MYSVIRDNSERLLATIPHGYVRDYEWIIQNREQCADSEYQRRYKSFWAMYPARLSDGFHAAYFDELRRLLSGAQADINQLCHSLYEVSEKSDGRKSLQFSFATKLLHMIDPSRPVYDSRIAAFFLFQEPLSSSTFEGRVAKYAVFYEFLSREYARVLKAGVLDEAIGGFRRRFEATCHADVKIVDWLIWAYVG